MQIVCTTATGKTLPSKYFSRGYTEESIFDVSIGKEYQVFGIAIYASNLLILLLDEANLPNWYPIELFSIKDSSLPAGWFFTAYPSNDNGLQAIWGYSQLVHDEWHYDALLERNPEALRIFYLESRRK